MVCRQKVHVFSQKLHVFLGKAVDFFCTMVVRNIQPVLRGSKSVEKCHVVSDYAFLCRALDFQLARNLVKSAKARNFAAI